MSTPPAAQPRSRLARGERMEQTLNVAHALFAERGYAAVTMDEVAGAVGVTKPLLYNYFGNKERLYIACMERAGDALSATIADAVRATASPGDALGAGLRAFFSFLDADRAAWAVLFDETLPHAGEVSERVSDYRGRILEIVAGAMLGQMPPRRRRGARVEVEALSVAVLGAAEALARWWLLSEALSAQAAAELLISTLEPGLRLRPSGSGGGGAGSGRGAQGSGRKEAGR
jgi:AcrR family transcriptional regulator